MEEINNYVEKETDNAINSLMTSKKIKIEEDKDLVTISGTELRSIIKEAIGLKLSLDENKTLLKILEEETSDLKLDNGEFLELKQRYEEMNEAIAAAAAEKKKAQEEAIKLRAEYEEMKKNLVKENQNPSKFIDMKKSIISNKSNRENQQMIIDEIEKKVEKEAIITKKIKPFRNGGKAPEFLNNKRENPIKQAEGKLAALFDKEKIEERDNFLVVNQQFTKEKKTFVNRFLKGITDKNGNKKDDTEKNRRISEHLKKLPEGTREFCVSKYLCDHTKFNKDSVCPIHYRENWVNPHTIQECSLLKKARKSVRDNFSYCICHDTYDHDSTECKTLGTTCKHCNDRTIKCHHSIALIKAEVKYRKNKSRIFNRKYHEESEEEEFKELNKTIEISKKQEEDLQNNQMLKERNNKRNKNAPTREENRFDLLFKA